MREGRSKPKKTAMGGVLIFFGTTQFNTFRDKYSRLVTTQIIASLLYGTNCREMSSPC